MTKMTLAVLVLVGAILWSIVSSPTGSSPAAFIGESVYRSFMGPLRVAALATLALLVALTIYGWRRALADARKVRQVALTRAQVADYTPEQFERWCAERLRSRGYEVEHVGMQGDHGVDLIARHGGETAVVQCKRHTGRRRVGEPELRDLFGAMHAHGAAHAIAITAGDYTRAARDWAKDKPIELLELEDLVQLGPSMAPVASTAAPEPAAPSCARCASPLVVRRSRATGERFWGCSRFPSCKYTRPL